MKGLRYRGLVYRALNPVYAREPLSGRGAGLFGGRFNKKGRPALYLALTPMTAIREANQVGTLQPTTLVAYRADIHLLFDTRDRSGLSGYRLSGEDLADPAWRERMLRGGNVPTQAFAEQLIADGFAGLLALSFARGSDASDLNLVLWRWNSGESDRLEPVDDEGRLR